MKKIIIIGGKGNGTVVASAIKDINKEKRKWEFLGFLNDSHMVGDTLENNPILGRPEDVVNFLNYKDCFFYYGIISAKMTIPRVKRLLQLNIPLEKFATIIHPTAVISRGASIGKGTAIMSNVFIGPYAKIGNHIMIHGHSYVARDTVLKDYSYMAPQATVGAEGKMEMGAYLGTAATVFERVIVAEWSVIGTGSVLLKSNEPYSIVVGSPGKRINFIEFRWND